MQSLSGERSTSVKSGITVDTDLLEEALVSVDAFAHKTGGKLSYGDRADLINLLLLKDRKRNGTSSDGQSYTIPFRCLYSCNIENLMMAGKHISVSHVASSATKLMGNGAQHGVAVALAAHLCLTLEKTPRQLYEQHLEELKSLVHEETSCDHDIEHNPPIPQFTPVPG